MPSDVRALARRYAEPDLLDRLRRALTTRGLDPDRLSCDDIAAIDQLHVGGRAASRALAARAGLETGMRVLDLGCGTGGTSRLLAAEHGAQVIGVDVTGPYLEVARWLSKATGLEDRTGFLCADAQHLPFAPATFDGVWSQHTLMNVPDPAGALSEVCRVLVPGGRLWLHEVVQGPSSTPPIFPVPWADDPAHSHLLTLEALQDLMGAAGLRPVHVEDVSEVALQWRRKHTRREAGRQDNGPGAWAPLSPALIFGQRFLEMGRNVMRNLEAERIRVVMGTWVRTG
ncbi:class I SAM-dependent methyltransferase [Ectothiorhodospira haloalkaliphila]|uniref:class I SAM-dependent methyltransferase n=1 Tax=Ectothiorhodospira TaxID=1051 RepID=UPI001EE996A5|nr:MULTISPECIES: class I SAM-dependent methyltransferase [Ectothiorhodospira]MCG5497309.1 class I SAM-dependent methyltransferase [Ectothiorhodospira variabilis]MCG5524583.1 class I SAM-dependent methyltransferase [Ectothiorhodospira haloalkaliphila]